MVQANGIEYVRLERMSSIMHDAEGTKTRYNLVRFTHSREKWRNAFDELVTHRVTEQQQKEKRKHALSSSDNLP